MPINKHVSNQLFFYSALHRHLGFAHVPSRQLQAPSPLDHLDGDSWVVYMLRYKSFVPMPNSSVTIARIVQWCKF